jgi:hypothetical protein
MSWQDILKIELSRRDATTYGVWVPNSLEDPAMKKAWEILKRPNDFQRFLVEVFGIPIADSKKLSPSRSLTNALNNKLTEAITENQFKALIDLAESKQYEAFITKLEQINSEYLEQTNKRTYERRKERYANDPEYRKRILQYNREALKRKYANDPEYRENRQRLERERKRENRNDPEYRERKNQRSRERYAERKKGPVREYRRKKEENSKEDVNSENLERMAGAVTTTAPAHAKLFKPTYGRRKKRKDE